MADRSAARQEDVLDQMPDGDRESLLAELLALEIDLRDECGESPRPDDYQRGFPRPTA